MLEEDDELKLSQDDLELLDAMITSPQPAVEVKEKSGRGRGRGRNARAAKPPKAPKPKADNQKFRCSLVHLPHELVRADTPRHPHKHSSKGKVNR